MKESRQSRIIDIVESRIIETQEELTSILLREGFNTTQATISRDIRELKLTKVSTEDGRQKYTIPKGADLEVLSKYQKVLAAGILSMEAAENLIVIKTVPGVAMAVGAALDNLEINGLMGCIAGDDTLFVVARTKAMSKEVISNIEKVAYKR